MQQERHMAISIRKFAFVALAAIAIGTAPVALAVAASAPATAPSDKKAAATPAARPYTEIQLDAKHTDPAAEKVVSALLKASLEDLKKMGNTEPVIYARFEQLGPDMPKTTIFATIQHSGVCGSSGCRTVILNSVEANKYSIVLDTNLVRLYTNLRAGKTRYDILAIVGHKSDGFGVHYWSEKRNAYVFAGVSKFKR